MNSAIIIRGTSSLVNRVSDGLSNAFTWIESLFIQEHFHLLKTSRHFTKSKAMENQPQKNNFTKNITLERILVPKVIANARNQYFISISFLTQTFEVGKVYTLIQVN